MKRLYVLTFACVAALSLFTFSCETLRSVVGTPSVSFESVKINSLDLEGITFACNYTIRNPYPVGISIKEIATDVLYGSQTFTKIKTDGGVQISANASRSNAVNFKIPYASILNFAKSVSGKSDLPFSLNGSVGLDLGSFGGSLNFPFTKSFSVPVFKPEFSFSDVSVKLPTLSTLVSAFTKGGISIARATQLANAIINRQNVAATVFDGVDLNLDIVCNLNVKNTGSAAWNFLLNNCSIQTSSGSLISLSPVSGNKITSSSGTIPLKASINTVKTGTFIAQIINKNGKNPVFSFSSGLTFPSLSYAPNIPLSYSREIPISNIKAVN